MQALDDIELLREYALRNSEAAFATLVERHLGLVYCAALRQVRDPQLAEEVTQAVFLVLARKGRALRRESVVSGWLYRTARYTALDALRSQRRRQEREQQAAQMDTTPSDASWEQISPLLDEAMAALGEKDRNAIVPRFFQQKPLKEVGAALGIDADTAMKPKARTAWSLTPPCPPGLSMCSAISTRTTGTACGGRSKSNSASRSGRKRGTRRCCCSRRKAK